MIEECLGGEALVVAGALKPLRVRYALVRSRSVLPSIDIPLEIDIRLDREPTLLRRGVAARHGIANPRVYHGGRGARAAAVLISRCRAMDSVPLLDTTRHAGSGPPVVVLRRVSNGDKQYIVIAGNGRAAMLRAAAAAQEIFEARGSGAAPFVAEMAQRWVQYSDNLTVELARCAALFGFPVDVPNPHGGAWMLVRLVDERPAGAPEVTPAMLSDFTAASDVPLTTAYDLIALAEVRRDRLAKNAECRDTLAEKLRCAMAGEPTAPTGATGRRRRARTRQPIVSGLVLQRWLSTDDAVKWFKVLCDKGVIEPESSPLFVHPKTKRLTTYARLQLLHLVVAMAFGDVELIEAFDEAAVVSAVGDALPVLLAWPTDRAHERWRYFFTVALREELRSATSDGVVGIESDPMQTFDAISSINGFEASDMFDAVVRAGEAVESFLLTQLRDSNESLAVRLEIVGFALTAALATGHDTDDSALLAAVKKDGGARFAAGGGRREGSVGHCVHTAMMSLKMQKPDAARAVVLAAVSDERWLDVREVIERPPLESHERKSNAGRTRADDRIALSALVWLHKHGVALHQWRRHWTALRDVLNRPGSPSSAQSTLWLLGEEVMRRLINRWQAHPGWQQASDALNITRRDAILAAPTAPVEAVRH